MNHTSTGATAVASSYGMYIDTGTGTATSSGTFAKAINLYVSTPSFGTTAIATYTDNLSVGYSNTTPPSNGAIINGTLSVGDNNSANYGSNKLYVNGATEINETLNMNSNPISNCTNLSSGYSSTLTKDSLTNINSITFYEVVYTQCANAVTASVALVFSAGAASTFTITGAVAPVAGTVNIVNIGGGGTAFDTTAGNIMGYVKVTTDTSTTKVNYIATLTGNASSNDSVTAVFTYTYSIV